MVSTYDPANDMLYDYETGKGRRVVTFNNILRDNSYPLAKAVEYMLNLGQTEMCRPVEIEFAGTINPNARDGDLKGHIYWLQIRPIIDKKDMVDDDIIDIPDEKALLKSYTALGHGNIDNVDTIVYVRPESFNSMNNVRVAEEIEKINKGFLNAGTNYILIGPGRWGSSDPSLGIPVKWPAISAARLIVEASLSNYRIEPSQGTHFFQNLTSFGVGYFTINPTISDGVYNIDYLNSLPAEYESERVRIVKFPRPLDIAINGKKGIGVVAEAKTPTEARQSKDY